MRTQSFPMRGFFDTVRTLARHQKGTRAESPPANASTTVRELAFERGYPTQATKEQAYDATDLARGIDAYRFFYPVVSVAALFKGNMKVGLVPNRVFGTLDTHPRHVGFTSSSDMPYAPMLLDLRDGPVVVELPPGPLMAAAIDVNQRRVADMGLFGPEEGHGARHAIVPPGYAGQLPTRFHVWGSTSNRVFVAARSVPLGGDVPGAMARLRTIVVQPLESPPDFARPAWIDLTPASHDATPLAWENGLQFWQELHEIVDTEPPFDGFRDRYGELAALGIAKGTPFAPDERMRRILERAARTANAEMRVHCFADRRSDRSVWSDRAWEWVSPRFDDQDFDASTATDPAAREKWFYQAIGASPSSPRRAADAATVTWLAARDESGAYLDGAKMYELTVPQPVPARLFWSLTVYDSDTRSQMRTSQGKAALRSLFELRNKLASRTLPLYFGPAAPVGKEGQWIKTIPGKGWFAYFRIHGPEPSASSRAFRLSDFKELRYG